MKYWCYPL